jgi:hypothetical protein
METTRRMAFEINCLLTINAYHGLYDPSTILPLDIHVFYSTQPYVYQERVQITSFVFDPVQLVWGRGMSLLYILQSLTPD